MRFGLVITLAVATAATTSCAPDAPTAPNSSEARQSPRPASSQLLPRPTTIVPLHRTTALAASEHVSATIGLLGGTLRLPAAGLTLVVPPLAIMSPTKVTAKALAGLDVAYEFSPHGLRFLAPVVAVQDLRDTDAASSGSIDPLLLFVGYFPNSVHLTRVTELLTLDVNLLGQTSTALLWHFSGYVWSSGRSEEAPPGDSEADGQ